jgi:hypothetical protein
MVSIKLNFSIAVPDWLTIPFIALALLYRRIWYGYPFRRIPLTQGKYAIVDPEDYEPLNKHKWHAISSENTFYVRRSVKTGKYQKVIRMHREVLKVPDGIFVDHINHNGLDERKANLRPATRAENNYNRRRLKKPGATLRFKGVSWHKYSKKWVARIGFNGKRITIGYFHNEVAAAKAYDAAAIKYHKDFAVLNFPKK